MYKNMFRYLTRSHFIIHLIKVLYLYTYIHKTQDKYEQISNYKTHKSKPHVPA